MCCFTYNMHILDKLINTGTSEQKQTRINDALFSKAFDKGFSLFVDESVWSYYKGTNTGSQCIFKVSRHEG